MTAIMRCLLVFLAFVEIVNAKSPVVSPNYDGGVFSKGEYPLLFELHNQTVGSNHQSFAFPLRNKNFRGPSLEWWGLGSEFSAHVWNWGWSGEFFASGFVDSLDFDIDAKFNWLHSSKDFSKVDGESIHELWDDGDDWVNYTRYRGHVGYNYSWLRFEVGRDAMHWGPGYYNNLTLNRQAVPYNYVSVDLTFGPLRALSFYSKLRIDSANVYTHKNDDRNFYAHRYELALGNLIVGVSEIQLIYNNNNPWLFAPVVPLFIEKGNYEEASNNGALAFDLNYRLFRMVRVYGEFFLDDMDSPIAVLKNDYLDSEWAVMFGAQIVHDIDVGADRFQLGSIFEIARVEQLVYSHYASDQGQLANAGRVLGNQGGPNSLSIDWLVYFRWVRGDQVLTATLRNFWTWKGCVYGSDFNQSIIAGFSPNLKKDYLGGAKMHYRVSPSVAYENARWGASAEFVFGYNSESSVKAWVRW